MILLAPPCYSWAQNLLSKFVKFDYNFLMLDLGITSVYTILSCYSLICLADVAVSHNIMMFGLREVIGILTFTIGHYSPNIVIFTNIAMLQFKMLSRCC